MATPWTTHLPDGAKLADYERGQVERLGGPPPIRIVPKTPSEQESKTRPTVSIKFTDTYKDTVMKFVGGTAEAAIKHIRAFWTVEEKLGYSALYKQKHSEYREARKSSKKVSDTEPGAAEQRVEYDAAAAVAEKEKNEARENLWGLFEQLLDNPLVADWQTIVKAETVEPGYITRER